MEAVIGGPHTVRERMLNRSTEHHDRNKTGSNHLGRRASDDELTHARMPVCAHYKKIDIILFYFLLNRALGFTVDKARIDIITGITQQ